MRASAGTPFSCLVVSALAGTMALQASPGLAQTAGPLEAAFVALGPDGVATARAITQAGECPVIKIDGHEARMRSRAAPSTEPLRPTASSPDLSKPSAFPVRVCDTALPSGARSAVINGHKLPVPAKRMNRVVVIGDTGCRLKAKDDAWQACNDPDQYPFAKVAAQAAAWKPDVVIHVGDYLYRENPCPEGNTGCAGSPWGYGWDAWNADFFAPGRALLDAAPWVVVRGNHENCARGGQGWWRLLDPRPREPGRDCNDPANDVTGDYSPAYAVPLGRGAQVVVMDLSHAGERPYADGDPRIAQYGQTWHQLAGFARKGAFTFAADHYPIFGLAALNIKGQDRLVPVNHALQSVFAALDPRIMPRKVDTLLAGHIHVWEQLDFARKQPSQFVAGFSGTQEDIVPLPDTVPAGYSPAPDAPVNRFSAIVDSFGYMTLERSGRTSWNATVYKVDGTILKRCRIRRRTSECDAAK